MKNLKDTCTLEERKSVLLPIVLKIIPRLLVVDILEVQPMSLADVDYSFNTKYDNIPRTYKQGTVIHDFVRG